MVLTGLFKVPYIKPFRMGKNMQLLFRPWFQGDFPFSPKQTVHVFVKGGLLIFLTALWIGSGGTPLTWCHLAYVAHWSQMWARRCSVYPSSCKVNTPGMNRWHWTRPNHQVNRQCGGHKMCTLQKKLPTLVLEIPSSCDGHLWLGRTSLSSCLFISWKRDAVTIPYHTFSSFWESEIYKHVQNHGLSF